MEVDAFDLEKLWESFGEKLPKNYSGHALSISDVVELSEGENKRFFYVDPKGFVEIEFLN